MESFKIFCEAIKALNKKIWYYNYSYRKECEQTKFLEETKMRFIDMYSLDKEIELAIIRAGEGNKQTIKLGLITTELIYDDNGNQVFVYIDLDTGKLCLGNEGGFPNLEAAIIDDKEIKSDFRIETTLPFDKAFNLLGISKIYFNNAKDYFKLLEYLRNNPSETLAILKETSIKR